MDLPVELITILVGVPVILLAVTLKKRHFVKLYYKLKPQSAVLKARIGLLSVGDQINHLYFHKGKRKDDRPRKHRIDEIGKDTICVDFVDIPKKYIRLLSNGELIALNFIDY
jgi:hypothetical protein